MNILQIRGEFSDNGPGTQCLTISTELRARGHTVIMCSSGGFLKKMIDNLKFKYYIIPQISFEKRSLLNVIISILKVRQLLIKEKIDIVHGHNSTVVIIAKIASFLAFRPIKTFQSVRGVEVRKTHFYRNWVFKLRFFNALFAVSEFTKSVILSYGVPEKKIVVSYNGTDLTRFDHTKKEAYRKEIRTEYNIPESATVIGLVGRQDGNKGHRLLIESFHRFYKDYPDTYIILVGEGLELEANKQLASELGVNDRCIFTELRLDVEKLHASFDIFTLLARSGTEMFPNVIVEAMTYAIPFVGTRTTGVPEMAKNGAGIICTCGDLEEITAAFIKLLDDKKLRDEMGKKGRLDVENQFNIKSVVDKIETTYKKFL